MKGGETVSTKKSDKEVAKYTIDPVKDIDLIEKWADRTISVLKNNSCVDCEVGCRTPTRCEVEECEVYNATQNALFAMEKQKPKEPLDLDDGLGMHDHVLCCPSCKNPITNVWSKRDYKPLFCHCCGQRFKWETVE